MIPWVLALLEYTLSLAVCWSSRFSSRVVGVYPLACEASMCVIRHAEAYTPTSSQIRFSNHGQFVALAPRAAQPTVGIRFGVADQLLLLGIPLQTSAQLARGSGQRKTSQGHRARRVGIPASIFKVQGHVKHPAAQRGTISTSIRFLGGNATMGAGQKASPRACRTSIPVSIPKSRALSTTWRRNPMILRKGISTGGAPKRQLQQRAAALQPRQASRPLRHDSPKLGRPPPGAST